MTDVVFGIDFGTTNSLAAVTVGGREAWWRHALHCEDWARKHGFDGFRICRGRFSDPFYLTAAVIPVVRG